MENNKNEEIDFKILHQQMLSGKMYNDLSPVLIKKRNRAVFINQSI
jgi:Maltose acetyltransferase.